MFIVCHIQSHNWSLKVMKYLGKIFDQIAQNAYLNNPPRDYEEESK